jgi:hypothetical protein
MKTVRRGYAMMLVLVFIVLFLTFLGIAYRSVATVLRVESVHALQVQRDEGSTQALAAAVALLETGLPPTDPYVCGVTVQTSAGSRAFTVTFDLTDATTKTFAIHSAPTPSGETTQPMPDTFAVPPP